MLSDIKLQLEFVTWPETMSLMIRDRDQILVPCHRPDESLRTFDFNISFPNQISFVLENNAASPRPVRLISLILGGLALPKHILDQICRYQNHDTGQEIITTDWITSGTVVIDFFTSNWIEYHLIYGNRIGV